MPATDLTTRPRLGLRGPGTPDWCAATGLPFPPEINRVSRADGLRLARLGTYELLILSDDGQAIPVPPVPVALAYDGYRNETWAWFRFEGVDLFDALSTLTAVDLRPAAAPEGSVVQTRLADLDVVLIIDRRGPQPAADLFFDIASLDYMRGVLADRCPDFRP